MKISAIKPLSIGNTIGNYLNQKTTQYKKCNFPAQKDCFIKSSNINFTSKEYGYPKDPSILFDMKDEYLETRAKDSITVHNTITNCSFAYVTATLKSDEFLKGQILDLVKSGRQDWVMPYLSLCKNERTRKDHHNYTISNALESLMYRNIQGVNNPFDIKDVPTNVKDSASGDMTNDFYNIKFVKDFCIGWNDKVLSEYTKTSNIADEYKKAREFFINTLRNELKNGKIGTVKLKYPEHLSDIEEILKEKEFEEKVKEYEEMKPDQAVMEDIEYLLGLDGAVITKPQKDTLSSYQDNVKNSINSILDYKKNPSDSQYAEKLKNAQINDKPLVDYWLGLSGKNAEDYTPRLKDKWFNLILKDENKTQELIGRTLDELEKNDKVIETTRNAYTDIINNEDELTPEQKNLLIRQQDSKLFFLVVSDNANTDDEIGLELNIIDTLRQLTEEKNQVKDNAKREIFDVAHDPDVMRSNSEKAKAVVNYIFGLLEQKMLLTGSEIESNKLKIKLATFKREAIDDNYEQVDKTWLQLVNIAEEYFNTSLLEDLTDRNIELLDSINKNMQDEDDEEVINLVNSSFLSIEQKEFVSRYKNSEKFKSLLNNPNINIYRAVEKLTHFEEESKKYIERSGLTVSDNEFEKIMSDKFKEIN